MASGTKKRRTSRLLLGALAATAAFATLASPRTLPWLAERFLRNLAERRGLAVGWSSLEGSVFDVVTIHDLRVTDIAHADASTDLRVNSVEITPRFSIPFFRPAESAAERVVIDGLSGRFAFHAVLGTKPEGTPTPGVTIAPGPPGRPQPSARWLPDEIVVQHSSFELVRGNLSLRVHDFRLVGESRRPGYCAAGQTEFAAGARHVRLRPWHGTATWQRPQLTLAGVDLGNTVKIAKVSVDLSRLTSGKLEAEISVEALSGLLRGQVAADFAAERPLFNVVGSLKDVAVEPVARLLGGSGPFAGSFDQGQFSFVGDPGDPLGASSSLRVNAREFRWRERRFESLAAAATLVNRRVQVQQFEFKQAENSISLHAETTLPERDNEAAAAIFGRGWMIPLMSGFSITAQARLENLKALGQLLDPEFSTVTGRMSLEGTIKGRIGDLEGYLNLEGGNLVVRALPLDFFKATLGFKGDEIDLADFQSTSGKSDYVTAKGAWQPLSSGRYRGEVKAQILDLGRYAPAYVGALIPGPLAGALKLEWSGDGNQRSHSGAFKAAVEKFSARRANAKGPVARPADLSVDGSYSPESLAIRELVLREGKRDALRLEGSLPWIQEVRAWSEGRLLDSARPLALRVDGIEAPLDLLPFFAPEILRADGRATGTLEISGTRAAPRLLGTVRVKNGAVEWTNGTPALAAVEGEVRFEGPRLTVTSWKGKLGDNDVNGNGTVAWDTVSGDARVDLAVRTDEFPWLDDTTANAEAKLELRLTGPAHDLAITGRVVLADGAKFYPRLVISEGSNGSPARALSPLALLPTEWFGAKTPLGEHRLDFELAAAKPFTMENAAGGLLDFSLKIGGTAREPKVMSGELRVAKSRVTAPAEAAGTWDLENAVFTFGKERDAADTPTVEVLASKRVGRGKITLRLSGHEASFGSEPPGPPDAAVARHFLLGTPLTDPPPAEPGETPVMQVGWK